MFINTAILRERTEIGRVDVHIQGDDAEAQYSPCLNNGIDVIWPNYGNLKEEGLERVYGSSDAGQKRPTSRSPLIAPELDSMVDHMEKEKGGGERREEESGITYLPVFHLKSMVLARCRD